MTASYRRVMIDQPVDPDLALVEEKLAVGEPVDAGTSRGEVRSDDMPGGGFEARVADSPIAVRLEKLFTTRNIPVPDDFAVYRSTYDTWLVPHRVSVVRRRGLSDVTALGIRVAYHVAAGSVVSLLPEFQFVELGSLTFCCSSDVYGSFQSAKPPVSSEFVPGGQLKVGIATQAGARLAFELSVATPTVSAVGKGSRRVEWNFERGREPLHGRDIETWSILVVPVGTAAIEYDLIMSLTRRLAFLPMRWESKPLKIACSLV